MAHPEPRIQELAAAVQGALRAVSDREVVWTSERDAWGGWCVGFLVLPSATDARHAEAYASSLTVSACDLASPYWVSLKWNLVNAVLRKMAESSRPARDDEVVWREAL